MFAPLILGVIALYLLIGWILLAAVDRRQVTQRRTPRSFVTAVLLWPITIVVDLFSRDRRNPPQ